MDNLPTMTVEKNDRWDTAHGLREPAKVGSDDWNQQLWDMLELVQAAKHPSNQPKSVGGGRQYGPDSAWPVRVTEIIRQYSPFDIPTETPEELTIGGNLPVSMGGNSDQYIPMVMAQLGFSSWRDCVCFVMDDHCDDYATRVLTFAQSEKMPHSRGRGFIDGDGAGYKARYMDRLKRKGNPDNQSGRGSLEKAFDAKYHFKMKRPLIGLADKLGSTFAALCLLNYVHPGHWSYPAGHGAKFFEVVDLARDTWEMTKLQDMVILVGALVLAMARSGGGVHFPRDNVASGYLAGLKEFDEYGE